MLIEFNTFQKHSADSKLSTNTYLMSVAAVWHSFYWNKATRFNIVRCSTLFTFGYPNLMLSLLQYISFYFNIKIATLVANRWLSNCGIWIRCDAYFYILHHYSKILHHFTYCIIILKRYVKCVWLKIFIEVISLIHILAKSPNLSLLRT